MADSMTDFTIILRSLTARRFSTVVTCLMVAVAVGLLLLMVTMRQAGQRAFEHGVGDMHLLVSAESSPLQAVLDGVFYAEVPGRPITWARYRQLVEDEPRLEYAIPIQQGDSYRGCPVVATTPAFFEAYKPHRDRGWEFARGRPFEKNFEIVAGAEAARGTGLDLGDRIQLTHGAGRGAPPAGQDQDEHDHVHHDFEFEVVGVLERTGGPHDRALFTTLESAWIIHAEDRRHRELGHVAKTTVDDLTDADRLITGIYLRVATREGARMSGAQQQVFDTLRRDPGITVASPVQEISTLFAIVSNVDDIFLALAGVVMVSSGIAIMLALYNSMEQRRRQIAVLRVLGCSRERIFGLVVTESALIGVGGAVAGMILAGAGGWIVAAILKARLGLVIEPGLGLEATLLVVVATILLAALAGVVPAAMAYRTPVVRNLRPLG